MKQATLINIKFHNTTPINFFINKTFTALKHTQNTLKTIHNKKNQQIREKNITFIN